MKLVIGFVAAATTFSTLSIAQTERDLGSHEHGSAILNIAIDDAGVFLELESPWNNFVGFEHAPSNSEQHAMVDDALAQLNQPGQLFSFTGSDCVSDGVDVVSALSAEDDHHEDEEGHKDGHDDHAEEDAGHADEHDDHAAEEADHADEHDDHDKEAEGHADGHDDHDKEEEGHADHDGEAETHASLLASFSFECGDVARLTSIDVQVLERWSGFEELDVQLIGPAGQALLELVPGQSVVDLTSVQ